MHKIYCLNKISNSGLSFFLKNKQAPSSTLFPYTTLFRSPAGGHPRVLRIPQSAAPGRQAGPRGCLGAGQLCAVGEDGRATVFRPDRSEEHTSELQSRPQFVCCLLLEKKKHA